MVGVAVQQPPWLVVMEYCEYGDLKGVLEVRACTHITPHARQSDWSQTCAEKGVVLVLNEQASFIQQLASGLAFLHNLVRVLIFNSRCSECLLVYLFTDVIHI
jgi:hypothetical protein